MEIGVSTASFFLRMYNEEALPVLNELDARVVEVFLETFSEYSGEFGEKLKKYKGDLTVHSVHVVTTQFEPQLFGGNLRAYKDARDYFESVLKCAKALGASNYTLHGIALYKKDYRLENYPHVVDRLNELGELAKNYGVEICLENVYWCMYNRPGIFSVLKNECPALKTCLDIKQARQSGHDVSEYLEEMAGRLNTVHLSDYDDSTDKMSLPGKGKTDFRKLFTQLKNVGFDGNMLIEVYKNDYEDVAEIKESLNYLRRIKQEVF